jgi:hypothetical protein
MFLGQETTQLIYFQTQQVNRYTTDNRHFTNNVEVNVDIGYFDNRACYTFRCKVSNLTSKKLKVRLR